MNLPRFSVRRPITTAMLALVVVVVGAVALLRIQVDLLPDIELPTVTVRAYYEGASPEVMERLVTQILEEIIATVPGVAEITSDSSEGRCIIRVSFGWGTDIDAAAIEVQSKIDDEISELPDDIQRPQVSKFDIASFPVVLLGISSRLDPVELNQLVENQLRYRFVRIPGVAQVDLWGGYEREIRVALRLQRIQALQIPLDRVLQVLRDANLDAPAGELEEGRQEITLRAPLEFTSLDQIRDTVVDVQEGAAVTLGQIAHIEDTYIRLRRIIRVNGERGLRVAIRKQADANTVDVARRILSEVEQVNANFPQVRVVPVINQGNFIERSLTNVARSVMYGGTLAVLVLLFFMGSARSTFVIALAIPISMLATLGLLFLGRFTLNLMTLGGLALGVGMMVDSSIVVLENIFRRQQEMGESSATAAIQGAREVAPAIVASTLTTSVVFLPLVFVQGIAGLLFQELAYVIVFSLTSSLLVSLTVLPAVASRLLTQHSDAPNVRWRGWVTRSENAVKRMTGRYVRSLCVALNHRRATVLTVMALTGGSLLLLPTIGSEFLPPSDEGEVRITGEMEVGTRLSLVDRQAKQLEALVFPAVPEMVSSVTSVGPGWRSSQSARANITLSLVPAAERRRSNVEIAANLRRQLTGAVAGMEIRTRAPQGQFLLARLMASESGLRLEVRGFDLDTLDGLATQVADLAREVPGVTDVEVTREVGVPQHELRIDRAKVADLGLNVRQVTDILTTAVAGSRAGEYRTEGDAHRIWVQMQNAHLLKLEQVLDITLTSGSGDAVMLRNVVTSDRGRGPSVIERKDQQRIVAVEANVAGRDLGSVAADLQARIARIARPAGYDILVAGDFEEQQKAFAELLLSLLLALVLVYAVLAAQYESLRDPLVVMLSVPVAVVGVLITLAVTGTTLNVQSYIGCIMLGGIVVNNAILLVDQAGTLSAEGRSVRQAVIEAGRRRLRPILMTTVTTILGLLPLALGIGEGADAQAPLARAVIGGLIGSTPLTLLVIPVVYTLLHGRSHRTASTDAP